MSGKIIWRVNKALKLSENIRHIQHTYILSINLNYCWQPVVIHIHQLWCPAPDHQWTGVRLPSWLQNTHQISVTDYFLNFREVFPSRRSPPVQCFIGRIAIGMSRSHALPIKQKILSFGDQSSLSMEKSAPCIKGTPPSELSFFSSCMRSLFCIDNRILVDYLCKIWFSWYNKKQATLNLSVLKAEKKETKGGLRSWLSILQPKEFRRKIWFTAEADIPSIRAVSA